MRYLALLIVTLGACNGAGPHFRDLPAKRITIGGSTFDVRVRGELAEAIRINPQYAPRLGPIGHIAARAMAMVSACEVLEVRGDQTQVTGILKCGDSRDTPIARTSGEVECTPVPGSQVDQAFGGVSVDLTCEST